MGFTDEERKVLLDASIEKLEESAKDLVNDIFSGYPHGFACAFEDELSRLDFIRKRGDFSGLSDAIGGAISSSIMGFYKKESEKSKESKAKAGFEILIAKLTEAKMLLEKSQTYLPEGDSHAELANLKCQVEMCEATLAYFEKMSQIAGSFVGLRKIMGKIGRNDS